MKTIAIHNLKGGCSKTTTSINIAAGLADAGYKTLLIDFDPQASTTVSFLDVEQFPDITVDDLMEDATLTKAAIVSINSHLDLIASHLNLTTTDTNLRLNTNAPQQTRLKKILDQVRNNYDYCIIDCPPVLNLLTVNMIIASDLIIVPITPEKYSLDGFNITLKNIKQIKENFELTVDYRVLVTMRSRNGTETKIIDEIKPFIQDKLFQTNIRYQAKPIKTSVLTKKPVIFDHKAGVGADYRRLLEELLEETSNG